MLHTWEMGEEAARLRTAADVIADLNRKGKSVADLAREMGYAKHLVYRVLSGQGKNLRGESHRIAVQLGIKEGEIA